VTVLWVTGPAGRNAARRGALLYGWNCCTVSKTDAAAICGRGSKTTEPDCCEHCLCERRTDAAFLEFAAERKRRTPEEPLKEMSEIAADHGAESVAEDHAFTICVTLRSLNPPFLGAYASVSVGIVLCSDWFAD
jgi:hypothetical protein